MKMLGRRSKSEQIDQYDGMVGGGRSYAVTFEQRPE